MKYGSHVAMVLNERGSLLSMFSGDEKECNLWKNGVETGLNVSKAKGYIVKIEEPERIKIDTKRA